MSLQHREYFNDYVYTPKDIAELKAEMEHETELLKAERKENEDLCPGIDQQVIDIEVVKEQILDLNDKFDFLINLMIKN
jgi:hypothetical protein